MLSRRESFKRQLIHEDLDPRVSLRWYPEPVDGYTGVLVDGLPDLAAWRGVLEKDPVRPILLVAANLTWDERRWLAEFPNLTLVRPAQPWPAGGTLRDSSALYCGDLQTVAGKGRFLFHGSDWLRQPRLLNERRKPAALRIQANDRKPPIRKAQVEQVLSEKRCRC